jgi:tyrosyl-tRNA synthetase
MSIPDEVVMDFFVLATNVPRGELEAIRHRLAHDPMATKKLLARTIVTEFWGEEAAREAEAHFERTVQRKEAPGDIPAFAAAPGTPLIDVIVAAGLAASKREARRLIEQGSVSIDGEDASLDTVARTGAVLQVGKRRWLRLI